MCISPVLRIVALWLAAYVASEVVTASAMHLTKMVVYQRYALIGLRELQYGLFLGIAMILGSWTGKRLIEHLPKATFRRVVTLLLVLSALQLIVFA
ncbi:MAG TPA: TSUP family transporter [Chloroflexaceae bacterium]|nr:TSUP family transporter [Chloroflexaceae bacterium]